MAGNHSSTGSLNDESIQSESEVGEKTEMNSPKIEAIETLQTAQEHAEGGVDKPVQKTIKFSGSLYRQLEEEIAEEEIADFTSYINRLVILGRKYKRLPDYEARIKELEALNQKLKSENEDLDKTLENLESKAILLEAKVEAIQKGNLDLSESFEKSRAELQAEIQRLTTRENALKALILEGTWLEEKHIDNAIQKYL